MAKKKKKIKPASAAASAEKTAAAVKERETEEDESMEGANPAADGGDEGEGMVAATTTSTPATPFLDAFYPLASSSPSERSEAARSILVHCFPPRSGGTGFAVGCNAPDASYALNRLLRGLNSGRASARQGFASALASFLKMALVSSKGESKGKKAGSGGGRGECPMDSIRDASGSEAKGAGGGGEGPPGEGHLSYVRRILLSATDPGSSSASGEKNRFGKMKGSEERDVFFGRLFGIQAVVRSGILVPSKGDEKDKLEEIIEVAKGFASDLIDLHSRKPWMREPAVHGLIRLLDSFSRGDGKGKDEASGRVLRGVLNGVLIPKLFLSDESDEEEEEDDERRAAILESLAPEQIALGVHVQASSAAYSTSEGAGLPFPLDEPLLSTETVPLLANALASTSTVVRPRVHLVWPVVLSCLAEEHNAGGHGEKKGHPYRTLRQSLPNKGGDPGEVVGALIREVVVKYLLGLDGGSGNSAGPSPTHERRALALSLVQALCGGGGIPPSGSPLLLPPSLIKETVLTPQIVASLFLDVITAGKKKGGGKAHTLRPMATEALEKIVDGALEADERPGSGEEDRSGEEEALSPRRRLAIASALLRAEPRFDSRTKTDSVSALVLAGVSSPFDPRACGELWPGYLDLLEKRILNLSCAGESATAGARQHGPYEALGLIDLAFGLGKRAVRVIASEDPGEVEKAGTKDVLDRALGLLMVGAFFDCSNLTADEGTDQRKKKKKKRKADGTAADSRSGRHPFVSAGLRVQELVHNDERCIPYAVRAVMSARFFSLLSDMVIVQSSKRSSPERIGKKSGEALADLEGVINGWKHLEDSGAVLFEVEAEEDEKEENEGGNGGDRHAFREARDAAREIRTLSKKMSDDNEAGGAGAKFVEGAAVLASTLELQMMSCGEPDGDDHEVEGEGDCSEEAIELLTDAADVTKDLLEAAANGRAGGPAAEGKKKDEEEIENPLAALAGLCVNLLSSSLGSGGSESRGASSKLVRDAVKACWSGGLSLAVTKAPALVDKEAVGVLLESVCGPEGGLEAADDEDEEADQEMDNADEGESSGSEEDPDGDEGEGLFSASHAEALEINREDDLEEARNDEDSGSEDDDDNNDDDDDDNDEDVELDHGRLESLLLEDSDAEMEPEGENVLEHHAGADAALAQLIKMKQQARKASQKERERTELSNRLRCMVLAEAFANALVAPSFARGDKEEDLPRINILSAMLVPLIRSRRALERSILSAASTLLGIKKTGGPSISEKKALVEKISLLVKTRICKARIVPIKSSSGMSEGAMEIVSDLMLESKRSVGAEHCSCCAAALAFAVKCAVLTSFSSPHVLEKVWGLYIDAVKEWSTRKSTKLHSSVFDDLVAKLPDVAKIALPLPLAEAAKGARSPFLRSESFRLLSTIYQLDSKDSGDKDSSRAANGKTPADDDARTSLESAGLASLKAAAPSVVDSVAFTLGDEQMIKAKRVREVLRTCERLVEFSIMKSGSDDALWDEIGTSLSQAVQKVGDASQSPGVKSSCEKLLQNIANGITAREICMGSEEREEGATKDPAASPRQRRTRRKAKRARAERKRRGSNILLRA